MLRVQKVVEHEDILESKRMRRGRRRRRRRRRRRTLWGVFSKVKSYEVNQSIELRRETRLRPLTLTLKIVCFLS